MTKRDFGRQYNSAGVSYWDYAKKKEGETSAIANGFSPALVEGFAAGKTAAMAQVCPDVK
jgi:hypothetical protein